MQPAGVRSLIQIKKCLEGLKSNSTDINGKFNTKVYQYVIKTSNKQ